jgi:hypothetical protein
VDEEKVATALFYWAPILIPGILQAESYARPLMIASPGPDSHESPEVCLVGRMERRSGYRLLESHTAGQTKKILRLSLGSGRLPAS